MKRAWQPEGDVRRCREVNVEAGRDRDVAREVNRVVRRAVLCWM
jgi:hypothetical protein